MGNNEEFLPCKCDPEGEKRPLSNAELLERLREYRSHLECELKSVDDKLKLGDAPGKEVRKMAEKKKATKKSGTLGKVVHELNICDCGCGCEPPLKK